MRGMDGEWGALGFPPPESPAGRLLKYLVSVDIPGLPLVVARPALQAVAALSDAEASAALAELAEREVIGLEDAPDHATLHLTVLIAPPHEEYGITPAWNGPRAEGNRATAAQPAQPAEPAEPALPAPPPGHTTRLEATAQKEATMATAYTDSDSEADHATTQGTLATAAPAMPPRPRRSRSRAAGPSLVAPVLPLEDVPPDLAPAARQADGTGPGEANAASGVERGSVGAPATRGRRRSGGGGFAEGRRSGDAGTATVDETAVMRGFVERFEQLLAELEEWKERAQRAEEQVSAGERQRQAAERRAEAAEARLAAADERAQAWAELTQRMQQLVRQADAGVRRGRSRPRARGSTGSEAATGGTKP